MIDAFVRKTGWHPASTLPVAGALAYSRYNLLVRFVMKRIARSHGAPTDTSRDYEFTSWAALDRFVDAWCVVPENQRRRSSRRAPGSESRPTGIGAA